MPQTHIHEMQVVYRLHSRNHKRYEKIESTLQNKSPRTYVYIYTKNVSLPLIDYSKPMLNHRWIMELFTLVALM